MEGLRGRHAETFDTCSGAVTIKRDELFRCGQGPLQTITDHWHKTARGKVVGFIRFHQQAQQCGVHVRSQGSSSTRKTHNCPSLFSNAELFQAYMTGHKGNC